MSCSNAQYMNSLFDTEGLKYKEPKMALQEISNDIKGIAENTATIFSNQHFVGADSVLSLIWGEQNKPWVFTGEGIDDQILKEERIWASKYIRWIPEDRVKNFNISKYKIKKLRRS